MCCRRQNVARDAVDANDVNASNFQECSRGEERTPERMDGTDTWDIDDILKGIDAVDRRLHADYSSLRRGQGPCRLPVLRSCSSRRKRAHCASYTNISTTTPIPTLSHGRRRQRG